MSGCSLVNFSGVEKKFEIELVVPVDLAPRRVLLKLERRETRIYTFWKYQTFILKQLKDAQQLHLLFFCIIWVYAYRCVLPVPGSCSFLKLALRVSRSIS